MGDTSIENESLVATNILCQSFDEPITHPVALWDDTLRDGEQTVGVAFSMEQKVEIAKLLIDAGLKNLTLGFPAVSEQEREAVRAVAKLSDPSTFFCLSRPIPSDIEAVVECGVPNVGLWVPISPLHLEHKVRMSPEEALRRMQEGIRIAREMGLKVRFGFEDATRAPLERLDWFVKGALDAGVDAVNITDTVGALTPLVTYRLAKHLKEIIGKDRALFVHFHNDLGLATANSLMACVGGAEAVQGSFAGLGERAGNVPLEEVAVALRVKYGVDVGVDLAKLARAATRIAEIAGLPVSPSKPVLGRNVFGHESGIHVGGVMRRPATYESFPPALVGREHEIHFGKHSGLSNMRYLADKAQIEADDEALQSALDAIKQRALQGASPSPAEAEQVLRQEVQRRVTSG